jgi:hypothetical protein
MARSIDPVNLPRRKKILIGVLIGAVVAIYVPMLFRGGQENQQGGQMVEAEEPRPGADAQAPEAPRTAKGPEREIGKGGKADAAPASKRDTGSLFDGLFDGGASRSADPDGDPKVTSIVALGTDRMAVIDGRIVRPGDRWKGRRVAEIREDGVVLRQKDETRLIPLVDAGSADGENRKRGAKEPEPPPR